MRRNDTHAVWTFLTGVFATMLSVHAAEGGKSALVGQFSSNYYKTWPQFSTRADETKSLNVIGRFGPVGISIELFQPAFQMRVMGIEKGSPAESCGKLKVGQIIESLNGQTLKEIDPRIQLGGIITQAEATDGKVIFRVKDTPEASAQEVVVQIPVLGAYSKTWPLNCSKSDKIVRNMADYLARTGNHAGLGYDLGLLFMLSTGEEKDLEVARGWVREIVEKTKDTPQLKTYPWFAGWSGIGLCEYYLRTGDASALPLIEKIADYLKRSMYNNGWSTRGGVEFNYYAGGQMNAAGVHCLTTLLLAKECGVKVDEYTLQAALKQFYRFAGHGNTPYGDHLPESGFVDNGKVGGLAFAMAAAASLTPDGEKSVYAQARDVSAVKGFYATSWMLHGHTGGGIGEIWRSSSMGLMVDKKPTKYREFMDNRMWHYELSRRFDGSFGILGGERYDGDSTWGNAFSLAYTIPRKTLRITGAKATTFCKTYKLPERPWGTPADDAFLSLVAAQDKHGKAQDVDAEKLVTDASWPILRKLSDTNVTDEVLLMYCRHPDQGIRETAYGTIRNLNRDRLIVELLKDKDPRARHSGAMVASQFARGKGRPGESERLTDEMAQLLIGMVNDPAESLWTVRSALVALSVARPELLSPHVGRLCHWLQQDEWWLQAAALGALNQIATDKQYYKQVLPLIGKMIAANRVMTLASQWGTMGQLRTKLMDASPDVQAFAVQVFGKAYAETPVRMAAPGGMNMDSGAEIIAQEQAKILAGIPGGFDELYKRACARYQNRSLPHQEIFLTTDPEKFGPELKQAIARITREKLIYEYMGKNRAALLAEAAPVHQVSTALFTKLGGLVSLYNKTGVKDYDWHSFGPELRNGMWDYFTFDPPEKEPLDLGGWRYRKVTLPQGMNNWFASDFDVAAAGWKKGRSPFGQKDGKLVNEGMNYEVLGNGKRCQYPVCGEHDPMHTFWDKEVLLMRGTFQFPALKPGHVYRLVVGDGNHVGSGAGYCLYLNGKKLVEEPMGIGKRGGGTIRGGMITTNFYAEFAKGPVTIAATSFLRYQDHLRPPAKPPVPMGIFSVWVEEMKLPPFDDAVFLKSAMLIPMTSAEWQAKQNPDFADINPEDGKFSYDGIFKANKKVLGDWATVALVPSIEAFDPAKPVGAGSAPFKEISFKDGGLTSSKDRLWSGDLLLELNRFEALKITPQTIGGTDYLFIEAGGFGAQNKLGWKSSLVVVKPLQSKTK